MLNTKKDMVMLNLRSMAAAAQGRVPRRNRTRYLFGHDSHSTWCRVHLSFAGHGWAVGHAQLDPSGCEHVQSSSLPHAKHAVTALRPPSLCVDRVNRKWRRNLVAIVNSLHHGLTTVFAAANECHHLHRHRCFHGLVVLRLRTALTGQTEKQQQ